MTLKGIDVSSWQPANITKLVDFDFAIMKATEGIGFVSPTCDAQVQAAKQRGKLIGVYHFARNTKNSSEAEADFFLKNIQGYLDKKTVLVLDWEDVNTSDVAWAKRWLDRVFEKTGVRPLIYMSESPANSWDWSSVAKEYGLWVAKYRDNASDINYNMALAGTPPSARHWKDGYAMWQWTSSGRLDGYGGDLDLNEFYGDGKAWLAYAGGGSAPVPSGQPSPAPAAPAPSVGTTYTVQPGDTLSGIAGRFGTSYQALAALNGIPDPNKINAGQVLKITGSAPAPAAPASASVHVVASGDTLSGIAARYGTTVQALAQINGIRNVNLIQVGQRISIGGAAPAAAASTYLVRSGDTLSGIAAAHGTSVSRLQSLNGIADPNKIFAGQTLRIG